MENPGLVNKALVDLLPAELGVRSGLPGEGKGPVPGFIEGYECQGGEKVIVYQNSLGLDPRPAQSAQQEMAKGIVAYLSKEGRLPAVGVQRRQKIAGSAAGVGGHSGISGGICGFCGEINEQFAQGYYIDHGFLLSQSFAFGYSVHSRR